MKWLKSEIKENKLNKISIPHTMRERHNVKYITMISYWDVAHRAKKMEYFSFFVINWAILHNM
jgi:hypothetical protein